MNSVLNHIENFLDGPGDFLANRKTLGRQYIKQNLLSIAIVAILLIISVVLFYIFSPFDISFSRLFYTDGFFIQNYPIGFFYTKIMMKILASTCILVGLIYIAGEFLKKPLISLTRRRALFIILSIIVSSVLITNVTFKNNWGRARPRDISEFNGTKIFSPAGVIANQCIKNCSFTSGDASFAFSFVCFALLARKRRTLWLIASLLMASSVAFMRVAVGAHFISDVTIGGIYTVLIILISQRLLLYGNKTLEAD